MKLTVLGNNGPYPGPGGACSGYLFNIGDLNIVLDFGNGTLSNLQKLIQIADIDFIICSHLHADHISDLFVLHYALQMKNQQLKLYAPAEPALELKKLELSSYQITKINESLEIITNGLTISFKELRHPFMDFGIKISDGETTFLYTGDTSYTSNLLEFAKGVDIVLCDGAFLEDVVSDKHLSVKEACEVATEAGVKTLILTHLEPFEKPETYLEKGKRHFKGNLLITEIGKTFDLKALTKV
ncbi:MBL fold metallo-hydrolase [Acetobacterium woodii]|uniref:MBL fold metallo-hydrolase n=1 Tax=Acetobacterium woodii TaxID=33952 RepID=UPI0002ED26C1|nr:MBL fold metallo-hydrolase [Acetobacterium woodii]